MTMIPLSVPIAKGPELIRTLTLRSIKLGDTPLLMRGATAFATGNFGGLSDDVISILAQLSGLPRSVVDEIDAVDLEPVLEGLTKHIATYTAKH